MLIADYPVTKITYTGADGRALAFQAVDGDGTAINLTGYVSVRLSAKLGSTYKILRAAMTVTAPATGMIEYTPTAAEIATVGLYNAQIRLEDADNKIDFLKAFVIDVRAPIDSGV